MQDEAKNGLDGGILRHQHGRGAGRPRGPRLRHRLGGDRDGLGGEEQPAPQERLSAAPTSSGPCPSATTRGAARPVRGAVECMKRDGTLESLREVVRGRPGTGSATTTVFPGFGVPGMKGYDPAEHAPACASFGGRTPRTRTCSRPRGPEDLRAQRGPERDRPAGGAAGTRLPHRPVGLGKKHPSALLQPPGGADRRHHSRRRHRPPVALHRHQRDAAAGRHGLPGLQPLPAPDGARQRDPRAAQGHAALPRGSRRGRPRSSSGGSVSPRRPALTRPNCPAGSSNGLPSPGRWPWSRRSS